MDTKEGILLKTIGGFYYVLSGGETYECKARGNLRRGLDAPVAGDRVVISLPDEGFAAIEKILPRQSFLRRPPVANLDLLVIVCSTVDPLPNYTVIDKMTVIASDGGITPVIAVSKNDIKDGEELAEIYRRAGFEVFCCSPEDNGETARLKKTLAGKTSAFIGNSGVGKSTLLNALFPSLSLATGEISRKLGRGRHTTRAAELFELDGCLVADTPGFSTVDLQSYGITDKDRLSFRFPEFDKYFGHCKFPDCRHIGEKGCLVEQAAREGKIEKTRYGSYLLMYNEIKDIKPWEIKKQKIKI